jgi:microcystin-dependent protein
VRRKGRGLGLEVGDLKWVGPQLTDGGAEQPVDSDPGWLLCNGAAVSRARYAQLFAAIGTAFGVGDGSTTFNLPTARGRSLFGQSPAGALATRGTYAGSKTHTLASGEIGHSHTYFRFNADFAVTSGAGQSRTASGESQISSGSAGGGGAHNNLSPYLTVGGLAIKAAPS